MSSPGDWSWCRSPIGRGGPVTNLAFSGGSVLRARTIAGCPHLKCSRYRAGLHAPLLSDLVDVNQPGEEGAKEQGREDDEGTCRRLPECLVFAAGEVPCPVDDVAEEVYQLSLRAVGDRDRVAPISPDLMTGTEVEEVLVSVRHPDADCVDVGVWPAS